MCVSEPHLKTGNSEATGVIRRRGHRDDEGAVRDVLIVETDGHLIVSYRRKELESESRRDRHANTKTETSLHNTHV